MNKIDPLILRNVHALGNGKVKCVVYTYNYKLAYRYLSHIVPQEDLICYPFIKAYGICTRLDGISQMANFDCVKYISSAPKVSALSYKSNNFLGTDNVVKNTDNICVAVIDTGCSAHLDLMIPKKIIKFVDLINDKKYVYDDNGHGTFVTGILCGSGAYSGGKYAGIDKDVNVICIKALDNNGEGGVLNILSAMQWIHDNKELYNIRVVCMSFGSVPIGLDDPLIKGAEALWDSGIVVVGAGGNSGPSISSIKAPGASAKIITVGALDVKDMSVAQFSSRGPAFNNYKPDVLAPGVNIVGLNHNLNGEPYIVMSGTSMSAPMIAGICSRIVKDNPSLTPNQVKRIVLSRCTPITYDKNIEGFGYYDKQKVRK